VVEDQEVPSHVTQAVEVEAEEDFVLVHHFQFVEQQLIQLQ
jgi:hypothetical protein